MKEITDPIEIEKLKEELLSNRLKEQKYNNDYDDNFEKCDICGSYLNSHGHCPKCEY